LGTLGGPDAVALLVNERGQVVGESYTSSTAQSAYCANNFGFSLTTGAFLWEKDKMRNLGSFGGTCTFATDINNVGEVVGTSTLAGDQFHHAFLWENDSFRELHNALGGDNGSATQINESGAVAGWASLPGNQQIHAALWEDNTMTDLGTLDGDPCSVGYSVNATEQVVGISGYQQDLLGCNSGQTIRAFLWEGGSLVDLNALIPPDSTLYLTMPETINDRGEIAGTGLDPDGNQHAFLLIPCDHNHPNIEGCDYSLVDHAAAAQRKPTLPQLTSMTKTSATLNSVPFPGAHAMRGHHRRAQQTPGNE
jgi:probable HAF family extracellular repeat protein